MGTKLHLYYVIIVLIIGFIEQKPIEAFITAVLFVAVSLLAYVPFVGFLLYMLFSEKIAMFSNSLATIVAFWIFTAWSLIVCVASSVLVVLHLLRR